MFASVDDAPSFLVHDIRFHRAVAAACRNPILASLVEMVSALFYEQRRKTVHYGNDLKDSAHAHRAIYHAIRARDPKRARAAMNEHLLAAQQAQALEPPGRDLRLSLPSPEPVNGSVGSNGSGVAATPPALGGAPVAAPARVARQRPRLVTSSHP